MSDITQDYSFGGWLRKFRLEKGLTLREASTLLGMDPGNYCRIEKSDAKPPKSAAEIRRFLEAYGATSRLRFMVNLAFQDHLATLRAKFRLDFDDENAEFCVKSGDET